MYCTYKLNETIIKDEDGMTYTLYGIDALDTNGNIVKSVKNIFFQRSRATNLINLCNEGELALTHLDDVIEEALYEQYLALKKSCQHIQ